MKRLSDGHIAPKRLCSVFTLNGKMAAGTSSNNITVKMTVKWNCTALVSPKNKWLIVQPSKDMIIHDWAALCLIHYTWIGTSRLFNGVFFSHHWGIIMANYFLWFIFGSVRNTLTDHPFSPQPSLVLFLWWCSFWTWWLRARQEHGRVHAFSFKRVPSQVGFHWHSSVELVYMRMKCHFSRTVVQHDT